RKRQPLGLPRRERHRARERRVVVQAEYRALSAGNLRRISVSPERLHCDEKAHTFGLGDVGL
ncbi:MAG TPA: hypothetical protein PKN64_05265, partial [Casimicrobium sp.]|nr:hypothetical protein [Casimicrobium sp.]